MTSWLHRRAFLFGAAAVAFLLPRSAWAEAPILVVGGKIAGGGERSFTLADLEAEPRVSFVTKTPWHATATRFEGIAMKRFLELVGASGTQLRLTALNDYVAEADIADVVDFGGILAYRENGQIMPVSDKGPLFLVFPFDSDERLRHQSIYARCVWQIASIDIL